MNFILDNWYVIIGVICLFATCSIVIYKFAGLPTKEQIEKIKKWLLYAVTKAEKELGERTGQLKLHTVYDLFISKFPITAKLITFEKFSMWVDDALDDMREMLNNNKNIEKIVKDKE